MLDPLVVLLCQDGPTRRGCRVAVGRTIRDASGREVPRNHLIAWPSLLVCELVDSSMSGDPRSRIAAELACLRPGVRMTGPATGGKRDILRGIGERSGCARTVSRQAGAVGDAWLGTCTRTPSSSPSPHSEEAVDAHVEHAVEGAKVLVDRTLRTPTERCWAIDSSQHPFTEHGEHLLLAPMWSGNAAGQLRLRDQEPAAQPIDHTLDSGRATNKL